MSDNFNLRKYLIENKATTNSKMVKEVDSLEIADILSTLKDYTKDYFTKKGLEEYIDTDEDGAATDALEALGKENAPVIEISTGEVTGAENYLYYDLGDGYMLSTEDYTNSFPHIVKKADFTTLLKNNPSLIENKVTTNSKIIKENEEVPFSSNDLKKVVIAGTTYEVGSDDPMDEGIIISIEKRKKGYFIIGQSGQEGYGYGIDFEGKEVEEEDLEDTGMTETKKKHSKMMKEANDPDREAIENWYHETNFYIDELSPEEIEKGIQDHYEEWTAVKDQYGSIEDYFADVERNKDWY